MHLRTALAAAALARLATLAPASYAQTGGLNAELQAWDLDHDGTLSLDEVKTAAAAEFDKLDADHEGTLSRKELGNRLTPREFRAADKDHEGTLSKEEYLSVVVRRFKAADADKDGTLTAQELQSAAGHRLVRLLR